MANAQLPKILRSLRRELKRIFGDQLEQDILQWTRLFLAAAKSYLATQS